MLEHLPYDVYQTPSYVEFSARNEGGQPMAFLCGTSRNRCLIPMIARPVEDADGVWRDASSPYGYPGILCAPEAGAADLRWTLEQLLEACRTERIVSVFIRLHPMQPLPPEALAGFGSVIDHGETVYVDLTPPLEQVRRGYRSDHRAGVKKLVTLGYSATIDDWDRLDEAAALYRTTMQRVGADPWYIFSDSYFRDWRASVGKAAHLCTVSSQSGTLAAMGTFTFVNGLAENHLSGSGDAFRAVAPAKLRVDTTLEWLRDRGCRRFHLGGGVGCRNDTLFQFKAGFSQDRARFRTFRMIADESAYAQLTRLRKVGAAEWDENYFPAYRAPKHTRKTNGGPVLVGAGGAKEVR
ncbi:MAG: GNAT family N-acetyltransferase [Bryobacteraceae bacterium]|nr:GNAT family N-acetyltransferase [Bryobacteraceae bacterium]